MNLNIPELCAPDSKTDKGKRERICCSIFAEKYIKATHFQCRLTRRMGNWLTLRVQDNRVLNEFVRTVIKLNGKKIELLDNELSIVVLVVRRDVQRRVQSIQQTSGPGALYFPFAGKKKVGTTVNSPAIDSLKSPNQSLYFCDSKASRHSLQLIRPFSRRL